MKKIYCLAGIMGMLIFSGCGNDKKDRAIDLNEEVQEVHDKQPPLDYQGEEYFVEIPEFKPSEMVNHEISTGENNYLFVRTYLINKTKLADVFNFYKTELENAGWKIDENRTVSAPDYEIYANDGQKELNIGMDGNEEGEGKFFLAMVVPKNQ